MSIALKIQDLQIVTTDVGNRRQLVRQVGFEIAQGQMLALVGESGSGKSMTAAAIGGLLPKGIQASGYIGLHGMELLQLKQAERRRLRGKEIGWVFQDYQGSFTPYLKIGTQLQELLRTHQAMSKLEARELVLAWLERVDLPASRIYASYPFQLSGGQLQRAAIAAALMPGPSLLIADEPTTALDVLTGERIMDALARLQNETGCAVLYITHDLRQAWRRAQRIAVMKQGVIVEAGDPLQIRETPAHPYTKQLLAACPRFIWPG